MFRNMLQFLFINYSVFNKSSDALLEKINKSLQDEVFTTLITSNSMKGIQPTSVFHEILNL